MSSNADGVREWERREEGVYLLGGTVFVCGREGRGRQIQSVKDLG